MAQTIKLKRSAVSGRVPTTSDLALGEVGLNTTDGKLFIKKSLNGTESIVDVGNNSAYLPLLGGTLTGNLNFGDNIKAQFGASNDLQIYHDSANSIIKDSGTGILRYTSSNSTNQGVVFEVENTDSTNLSGSFIHFKDSLGITPAKIGALSNEMYLMRGSNNDRILVTNNSAVELYHSDDKKFETSSSGVSISGNIAVTGTVDGRDIASDGTKLDGIESGATADQTDAEIRTAIEAASDSNVFTDADHSKLNAIEASADVTDTTNVTAAGALMDSEVTNLAQVKAFDSADYATAAQGTTADNALPKSGGTLTGNLNLGDNIKAQFGASNDLQIYHDSANSIIKDSGAGILRYTSSNSTQAGVVFEIENTDSTNLSGSFIHFKDSLGITPAKVGAYANELYIMRGSNDNRIITTNTDAVELYYADNEKLTTTSSGIDVTGTVKFDGLEGTNSVNVTQVLDEDNMASDSATSLSTQQSIKSYVDTAIAGVPQGDITGVTAGTNLSGGGTTGAVTLDLENNISLQNITLTGYLRGPSSFTIDPAAHGDDTGTLVIAGNLQVDGTTTTINSTTVEIADLNFKVAKDATSNAEANTGGFTVGGSNAELKYLSSGDKWTMNKTLSFADSLKTTYGDNDDLQIYHDGSNSYIKDAGTGRLVLQSASDFLVSNTANTQNYIYAQESGYVRLYHAGSTKLATTSTGIDVTGVITTDGLTTSADINFGDNDKAKFGASGDLEIYHDGSNSIIKDSGTGILRYTSSNSSTAGVVFEIENTDSTNLSGSFIHFKDSLGITPAKIGAFANELYIMRGSNDDRILTTNGGAAELYYSDDEKLATTSTGIDVTGTATMDGLTVDGAGSIGLVATDRLYMATSDGLGIQLDKDNNRIVPVGADGSAYNNNVSLGASGLEFKNLFLSGSVTSTGLTVNGANAALMSLIAPTDNATFALRAGNSDSGVEEANIAFYQNNAAKWQLGNGTDNSFKLYNYAASNYAFTVASTGNVNIPNGSLMVGSTTAPSKGLHLKFSNDIASVRFENTANAKVWDLTAAIPGVANSGFSLHNVTDNTIPLHIDNSNRVGIGSSSPSFTLDAYHATDNGVARFQSGDASAYIALSDVNTTSAYNQIGVTTHDMWFMTNNTERMRIDSSGNVGIGVTNPSDYYASWNNLVVGDTSGSAGMSIVTGTSNEGTIAFADGTSGVAQYKGYIQYNQGVDRLVIGVNSTERMRIDSSGRVGIGCVPQSNLDIDVGLDTSLGLRSQTGVIVAQYTGAPAVGNRAQIGLGYGNTYTNVSIGAVRTSAAAYGTDDFIIATKSGTADTAPTERMRIDSSGNLLVGKTALDNSTVGIRMNATGDASFVADGARPLVLNRKTSDGDIALFLKDGTTVGSIGTFGGDLFIGNNDSGLRFEYAGLNAVTPFDANSTASSDGVIDLGYSNSRFKDLYLSGSVNIGDAKTVGHGAISLKYDLVYMTAGVISPADDDGTDNDNSVDLGKSAARFNDVYATNGTIQTSDRNEKQDIEDLTEAEERVAVAAKGLLKKFRWKDAVEDKGDDARIHFGIIAQDLQDAFEAEGLDAGRYAMFISTTWTNEDGEEQTRMGVRYSELLAFIISAI